MTLFSMKLAKMFISLKMYVYACMEAYKKEWMLMYLYDVIQHEVNVKIKMFISLNHSVMQIDKKNVFNFFKKIGI